MRTPTVVAAIAMLTAGLALSLATKADSPDKKPSSKLLRHVVLYKFKDDLTPQQVQEVVEAFAALPRQISSIVSLEHGTNVSSEGKSKGLTHIFVVTFRDEQGRDAYLKHPAHDEYVKVVKDRREKVIVFDYWTEAN